MRVSTVREGIQALGGELKLVAKFHYRTVDLSIAAGEAAPVGGSMCMASPGIQWV